MSELTDLYQEVILDHNKRPRNFALVPGANRRAEGHNPLCGDRLSVTLRVEDGVVREIGFVGAGCAISKASASMMTEAVKGRTVAEAESLFERFHEMVTGHAGPGFTPEDLDKLAVFEGVREFPVRVKCASLAWHTLKAALVAPSEVLESVTTE
ncbi:MAG TPA: SUF system NifU family Fe-S cluster assembly protein [Verrucomicrobiae bacterium]|nr:SUF system NifU family Fe-S cluster assembly protein [Verrucomicrobiae bacterium]